MLIIIYFCLVEINRCSGFVTHTLHDNNIAHLKRESSRIEGASSSISHGNCKEQLAIWIKLSHLADGSSELCHHPDMAVQHCVEMSHMSISLFAAQDFQYLHKNSFI